MITVENLIEKLQQYPGWLPVRIDVSEIAVFSHKTLYDPKNIERQTDAVIIELEEK